MRRIGHAGLLAVALLIADTAGAGAGISRSPCQIDPVLTSLETRDPIAAANKSVAQDNFVLLGVYTFSSEVPGVTRGLGCWKRELGIAYIPDTGDGFRCEEHH